MATNQELRMEREKILDKARAQERRAQSWYCDKCCVEVYYLRCKHCGKSAEEIA